MPTVPFGADFKATISGPHSSPIVGMPYNLSCMYNISEGSVAHTSTVLWIHPNKKNFTTPSILFDTLHASDSGEYTCRVTLTSSVLEVSKEVIQTYNLTIQRKFKNHAKIVNNFLQPAVPPRNVSVSVPNTTLYAGSTVNLTCNVILASEIDVSVMLNVTWLQGNTINTTLISLFNTTSFTSILPSSPLSAADSNITCLSSIIPIEGPPYFLKTSPTQSASETLQITSESIILVLALLNITMIVLSCRSHY